jgi:hypothetical protein
MAILNLRTGLKQRVTYKVKTGMLRYMRTSSGTGTSNEFNAGTATNNWGHALNFVKNYGAVRELPYVRSTRFLPLP